MPSQGNFQYYESVKFSHDIYDNLPYKWVEEKCFIYKKRNLRNQIRNLVILYLKNNRLVCLLTLPLVLNLKIISLSFSPMEMQALLGRCILCFTISALS